MFFTKCTYKHKLLCRFLETCKNTPTINVTQSCVHYNINVRILLDLLSICELYGKYRLLLVLRLTDMTRTIDTISCNNLCQNKKNSDEINTINTVMGVIGGSVGILLNRWRYLF